ncbi:hypothetical protein [Nocardia sp. NPDC051832]|uniref:hypothetical protein n=1 Tax=Nocardia sp. NPDC051832 TaxID=3155673 RepID=UPI003426E2ED
MELNVDPRAQADAASALARVLAQTEAAIPSGQVVPAGVDRTSAVEAPRLDARAGSDRQALTDLLGGAHRTAHDIGKAAQEYSRADDDGARLIGGAGADLLSNPVPEPGPGRLWAGPIAIGPAAGVPVDMLTYARQLRAGPGPTASAEFARDIRAFLAGPFAAANDQLTVTQNVLRAWTPHGYAAAEELSRYGTQLGEAGMRFAGVADDIDAYLRDFETAKDKHPTPDEIRAVREKLLAAVRADDEVAIQKALAEFRELHARSAETAGAYESAVASRSPADGQNGGGDASALSSMLPLISALSSAGQQLAPVDDPYLEEGLYDDEYPYSPASPGYYPSGTPAAGPVAAQTVLPAAAVSAAASTTGANLPRAAAVEPRASLPTSSAMRSTGMPYMPYAPMAPGMGQGAGPNNERNRVVAWHPDRLMYVDDTPHTDLVIGERPTIAPTVTPPTPAPQSPTRSGGTA